MTSRGFTAAVLLFAAVVIILLFAAGPAQAALFYTFEARESYEDNASGLVTDDGGVVDAGGGTTDAGDSDNGSGSGNGRGRGEPMPRLRANVEEAAAGEQGDFATELYADIGVISRIAKDRSLTASASAQHTAYARFDQFDFTILRLSAGLTEQLTDIFSARLTLNGKAKYYDNPLRNSTAAGVTASLRERLGPSVRLRQVYDFERNSADSPIYSFSRNSIGAWAGFDLTPELLLDLGYSYLLQEYDEPASSRVATRTFSAELAHTLGRGWDFIAGYDREMNKDDTSGLSWTNNIFGVGLRYLY